MAGSPGAGSGFETEISGHMGIGEKCPKYPRVGVGGEKKEVVELLSVGGIVGHVHVFENPPGAS